MRLEPTRGGLAVTFQAPELRLELELDGAPTPLTAVSDVGHGARLPGATVKQAGLHARGEVLLDGRRLSIEHARACVDWTEGFFPRHTRWQWATGAGDSTGGVPVGFNLALGVHDGARHSENALWVEGAPAALPPVKFQVTPGRAPWTVRSADGAVDLRFRPRAERTEDVNLGLVSSRYRQPFGHFEGRIRDARGREVELDGVPGVAEDHDAIW
jgi:hypothetical protein